MCFSATASFGASALLGGIGIVAIAKAKTGNQRVFATVPLFFSVQQFSEGMLWLSLKNPALAEWESFFTYTFLVFAMAVWPLLIPFTTRLLEKDAKRKKIMNVLIGIGAIVSIGVCCILLLYSVHVIPMYHHLHYRFNIPQSVKNLIGLFSILYIIATVFTPFISSIKKMKWLGIVFIASYLFAVIFYPGFVISVWCFFAAIMSIIVLWIILELRK
ncbi:MAG: hypothetical protein JJE22_08385 [Bacteroidia bacterium]|nr:hypothetical protein [Bacteroidia bacterium]